MDKDKTQPSEISLGIAARAWCTPTTSHITMVPELATVFAEIIDDYREALIWCSGSADFGPGGQATKGWDKICKPLIDGEKR